MKKLLGNLNMAWLGLGLLPLSAFIYVAVTGNSLADPYGHTAATGLDYAVTLIATVFCVVMSYISTKIKK